MSLVFNISHTTLTVTSNHENSSMPTTVVETAPVFLNVGETGDVQPPVFQLTVVGRLKKKVKLFKFVTNNLVRSVGGHPKSLRGWAHSRSFTGCMQDVKVNNLFFLPSELPSAIGEGGGVTPGCDRYICR